MKPIEPGCLAIVIGSVCGNDGRSVRCIRPAGIAGDPVYTQLFTEQKWWLLDTVLKGTNGADPYCEERKLIRIDGHEEPTTTERVVEA